MIIAIQLAIKNVYRKRERSFLTIVGVLLAIASFISLLSIAEGLYQRVEREIRGRQVDIYIIPTEAAALPTGPIGTIGFSSEVIPVEVKDKLETMNEISFIAPIYRIQERMGNQSITVMGIDSDDFQRFFPYFKLAGGSRVYLDEQREIVVGGAIANLKKLKIGMPITVDGAPFEVVGIGEPINAFQDYFSFIPLKHAMELKNARGYHESWLQIQGKTSQEREKFALELKKQLPAFEVLTREQYLGSANEYVNYAWLLQFAIAAIGILIATTAAMNTMLMSTYERIDEFGTLRSLGASRFIVAVMIFTESLILTTIGGLGGILLGILGSKVLDAAVKALLQLSFPLAEITFPLIIYSVLLSIFVGVIGAVIPAIIIYRMSVIEALRWQ